MRKEETVETVAQPRPRTEIYVHSVSFVEKEDGGVGDVPWTSMSMSVFGGTRTRSIYLE